LAAVLGIAASLSALPTGAADLRDQVVLENIVKDLGIGILSGPDSTTLRLPLAARNWSFLGRVRPYAAVGPRAQTELSEPTGLALPMRETDQFAQGLDVGAGMSWSLGDRLELFGEYQLLNMGRRGGRPDNALGRRDVETPGLQGGFSIRF
jgi:hypothetical protein